MERNIIRDLEDYKKKQETGYFPHRTRITTVEAYQLIEHAKNEAEGQQNLEVLFLLAADAWEAGYMAGYKRGRRSKKK